MGAGLSGREEEVLALVAQGLTNAQVAARLGISPLTVKKHLERMYEASGVRNRAELVARTYRRSERRAASVALPVPLTSFVGRERELAEVLRLLEKHRLLTLGGPGGIGKTRLATVAAAAAGDRFPDGVHIVELASLSDARLVASAVSAALGVPERSTSRAAAIVGALREKEALLILDNCEHVVGPTAELAVEILRGCAAVRVLATSREPLGVPGEAFWPVPPLTLPDLARSRVVDIAQSEAVRLFIERAALRVPAFDLAADNARAVAAICRGLDGVPLAIELAAARMSVLSAHEIAARLDDRFRELRTDDAAVTPRHRTLRGVVEWSYQMLSRDEAHVFEELAIFAGGCAVEAALAVCEAPAPDDPLHLIGRLVDRSFVISDTRGREARYRLLETLQRFGRERLRASGRMERVRARHASYYLALAGQAETALRGPHQVDWHERLAADIDNVRAALEWSMEHDPDAGLRASGALGRFWFHRGQAREGLTWIEQLLDKSRDVGSARTRMTALTAGGVLAHAVGQRDRSEEMHRECLELARAHGEARAVILSLENLVGRVVDRGGIAEARRLADEAVIAARAFGDRWCLAIAAASRAAVGLAECDTVVARDSIAEALPLMRAVGDRDLRLKVASGLGDIARLEGRWRRASQVYRRCLFALRSLGDLVATTDMITLLGILAAAEGRYERAARLLSVASAVREPFGWRLDGFHLRWHDEAWSRLRVALPEDTLGRLVAEASSADLDGAVVLALRDE